MIYYWYLDKTTRKILGFDTSGNAIILADAVIVKKEYNHEFEISDVNKYAIIDGEFVKIED